MKELATRDPLTGIGNRRWFDEEAQKLLLAERSYPCSLLLLDTDRFKEINDARGHVMGDEVLRLIATVLAEVNAKVKRGCCARIGGDEFGMLCPGTATHDALILGEMLRTRIAETKPSDRSHVTVSVGVATAQEPSSLIELLRRADHALYRAKAAGRNVLRSDTDSETQR